MYVSLGGMRSAVDAMSSIEKPEAIFSCQSKCRSRMAGVDGPLFPVIDSMPKTCMIFPTASLAQYAMAF
jgi:hypothetical protein